MMQRIKCVLLTIYKDINIICTGKGQISDRMGGLAHGNAAYSLLLPGKIMYLNALLAMKKLEIVATKKVQCKASMPSRLQSWGKLSRENPSVELTWCVRDNVFQLAYTCMCIYMYSFFNVTLVQLYEFRKAELSSNPEEAAKLAEKLMTFGVSLMQFKAAIEEEDITMYIHWCIAFNL